VHPNPLSLVTPLILTYNEDVNIERTLSCLGWASRVLVVDSGSTDCTLSMLEQYANVEVVYRPFDSFANQCNYGLSLVNTPWCLSLDADHRISPQFREELYILLADIPPHVTAVLTPFRYFVFGKPLRGTLLPARFNLVRPSGGTYHDDGHAHRFIPSGSTISMRSPIYHDDRKNLERWLASQYRYQQQESEKLVKSLPSELSLSDRLRKLYIIAPVAVLFVCLLRHRGLLDGWRGWYYAFQRVYAEILLSLILLEKTLDTLAVHK
jgi:glycosyltransferase involved in cell wall biosynthesis